MAWWFWLACMSDRDAHRAYAHGLAPVLLDNGLLADQILDVGARVHDESIDDATLRARWIDDVAPLADRVAIEAAALAVPPVWQADHQALVALWRGRATALRDTAWALDDADPAAFDHARGRAAQAQLDEESWFRAANERLASAGLALDPHP